MKKLNIGMIGAGFIGQLAHFMNFVEVEDCKVAAVAEYKPELRKKVATHYDIPKAYATHQELLADPEIDAVVIVTPRPFTGPTVLDSLNAGKHVLSEKPMVGSVEQGRLLLDAAKKNQVKYAVGYMKRYDAGVERAKQELDKIMRDGTLGPVLAVTATCFMGNSYCYSYGHVVTDEKPDYPTGGWSIAPDWLPEKHHAFYGAYVNTYTHVTNMLRYFFDKQPTVDYVNITSNPGSLAVLGFGNFQATLQTGKMSHGNWSEEVRITFADGEMLIKLPPALLRNVPATVEIYHAGKTQETFKPFIDWSWSFKRQAEAFVKDVLEDRPMKNCAEEGLKDVQLTEDIWSAEMKRLNSLGKTEEVAA